MKKATSQQLETLTPEENAFLRVARRKFSENTDWFAFEDFAFGMRSPLFSKSRSHRDVLTNPLYLELNRMWLELGVKQGRIANPEKGNTTNAPRRSAKGRR